MNERIRQLAEQARKKPFGSSWCYTNQQEFEQKFAQLIVAECVSLMEWQKISPKDDGAYNSALSLAQRNIKEQFGVEE